MKLFKRKIVWLSILSSIISIPTIILSNSLQTNNSNQTTIQNDVSNYTRSTKALDPSIANLYASEIRHKILELIQPEVVNTPDGQTALKEYLKKLFPTELAQITPEQNIGNLKVTASSTKGNLYINFDILKDNKIVKKVANSFELTKKGTTDIEKLVFSDSTKSFSELEEVVTAKTMSYFVDNGIVPVVSTLVPSTIEYDIAKEPNEGKIVLSNIRIANAIGNEDLVTYSGKTKTITLFATKNNATNKTTATINNTYLTDSEFANANTPELFKSFLDTKKTDEATINKIVTFNNAPTPLTKKILNVTLKTIEQSKIVEVVFEISSYYNDYGVLISEPTTFTIIYNTFPINTNYTLVIAENTITGKDYAYQYNESDIIQFLNADIAGAKNIIKNAPTDATVSAVQLLEVNNRTGVIKTNITLNKAYDINGSVVPNKQFTNILFNVPKTVNQPTTLIRNANDVEETIRQIDAMGELPKKEWAKKYIEANGKVNDPATIIDVQTVSKEAPEGISGQLENAAWYKVTAKLTNYIKNDDKYSLITTKSEETFTVYINAKMNVATIVKNSVAIVGIDADGTIANFIPKDLINPNTTNHGVLKQWIVDKTNQNLIFDNYVNDMTISNITSFNVEEVVGNNRSIKVTLTLNNAFLSTGLQGSATFSFNINNLVEPQQLTEVKAETDVSGGKVVGISGDEFTLDIYNDKENLKQKMIDAINNPTNLDKFFNHAPNEEQRKGPDGQVRPIVRGGINDIVVEYNNTTLTIQGYFLARVNENPNAKAEYKQMTLTLVKFNGNNTALKKTEINIATDPDLKDETLMSLTYNQVTAEQVNTYIKKNVYKIFNNIPLSHGIKPISVISKDNKGKSIDVNITIYRAKVDVAGDNKGFGEESFTLKLVGFVDEAIQIVGKTLNVDDAIAAGLVGLTPQTYSIDFENKFKSSLPTVLFNNMDMWFDNTNTTSGSYSLKDKVTAKNFVNIDSLSFDPQYNAVTITGNFLGWNASLNPRDTPQEITTTIKIIGFNGIKTEEISPVDISSDPTLSKLAVDDANILTSIKKYVENNKDAVFNHFPEIMSIGNIGHISKDVRKGEITVTITVNNAMLNSAYGEATFEVKFIGFIAKVEPTSGKTLNVDQAREAGVTGLDTSDYAFDFESDFKQLFISSIKANPNSWLQNAPDADKIASSQLPIVDESSLSFTSELDNFRPILRITGNFISWNTSNNANDPLIQKQQTITITGFNNQETTVNGELAITDEVLESISLVGNETSIDDAAKKLNEQKEKIKEFLKSKLADIQNIVTGKPSSFNSSLQQAIEGGNFEFVVKNNSLQLVIHSVDQSKASGSRKESTDLIIPISNKFNSNTLNTKIIKNTINWNEPLFKEIFKNKSVFAFDWKNDFKNNASATIFSALKDYISNNKKVFFAINENVNFDWSEKITITAVNTNSENDSFINSLDTLSAKIKITYNGYVKGTLKPIDSIITINLKATPTEDEILNKIQETLNNQFSGKDIISEENYEQYIKDNAQNILDTIKDSLKDFLPGNLDVEFPKNEDGSTKIDDIFELSKDNNGNYCVSFKPNSITIKPNTNVNADLASQFGQITLPKTSNRLIITSLLPTVWWYDWVIYATIASTVVLLALIIAIYEYYINKKRKKSEISLG